MDTTNETRIAERDTTTMSVSQKTELVTKGQEIDTKVKLVLDPEHSTEYINTLVSALEQYEEHYKSLPKCSYIKSNKLFCHYVKNEYNSMSSLLMKLALTGKLTDHQNLDRLILDFPNLRVFIKSDDLLTNSQSNMKLLKTTIDFTNPSPSQINRRGRKRTLSSESSIGERTVPQMGMFSPFSLDKDVLDAVDKFTETIGKFTDKAGSLDIFDKPLRLDIGMQNPLKSLDGPIALNSAIVAFSVTLTHHFITGDKTSRNISVASGLFLLYRLSSELTPLLTDLISRFSEPKSVTEPQIMDDQVDGVFSAVTLFLSTAMIFTANNKLDTSFKSLVAFDRVKNTLVDLFNGFCKVVEEVVKYLKIDFFGISKSRFIESSQYDVNNFLKACDEITGELDNNKFDFTKDNLNKIQIAIKLGNALVRDKFSDREYRHFKNIVSGELSFLKKLKDKFVAATPDIANLKQEPVAIYIAGSPGIGKSITMLHLFHALAGTYLKGDDRERFLENPSTFLYNCQSEAVYHDGYKPTSIVTFFDDFGQNKTIAGQPDNEFMMATRMINCFPYNLHMAALADKGVTLFDSKFVVFTSNMTDISCEAMYDINAIKRRLNSFAFHACPKDLYVTPATRSVSILDRKLDITKVPLGVLDISSLNPALLDFHAYDLITGKYTGKILDFDSLIDEVIVHYGIQEKRHKQTEFELKGAFTKQYSTLECKDHLESMMSLQPQSLSTEIMLEMNDLDSDDEDENVHKLFWDKYATSNRMKMVVGLYYKVYDTDFFPGYNILFAAMEDLYGDDLFDKLYELDEHAFGKFMEIAERRAPPPRQATIYLAREEVTPSYSIEEGQEDIPREPKESDYNYFKRNMVAAYNNCIVAMMEILGCSLMAFLDFADFLIKHRYLIAFIAGLITTGTGITRLAKAFSKPTKSEVQIPEPSPTFVEEPKWPEITSSPLEQIKTISPESLGSSGKAKSRQERVLTASKIMSKVSLAPQLGCMADDNGDNIMTSIMNRNFWEFYVAKDADATEFSRFGYVLQLQGTLFLMPYHFVTRMASFVEMNSMFLKYQVKLVRKTRINYISIKDVLTKFELVSSGDNDLCVSLFPEKIQKVKSIIENFPTPQEVTSIREHNFILYSKAGDKLTKHTGVAKPFFDHHVQFALGDYTILTGYQYAAPTRPGDCGALLSIVNKSLPRAKIFGMHVAGVAAYNDGYSGAIDRLAIQECLDLFSPEHLYVEQDIPDNCIPHDGYMKHERFETICSVPKTPCPPYETSLMRSALISTWGPAKELPAKLRPGYSNGVYMDPMYNALSSYCRGDVFVDQDFVDVAIDDLFDTLRSESHTPGIRKLMTLEESIMGIVGDNNFNAVSRSTSLGYPYNTLPLKDLPGKTRFLGTEDTFDLKCPGFREFLDKDFNPTTILLKAGIRPFWVFSDFPKDERRTEAKVLAYMTRNICAAPFSYSLQFRIYFGNFILWMNSNRIKNGSAVCVNPYGEEWNDIARLLLKFGPISVKDGDFKFYDGSELSQLHWAILHMINRWYGGTKEESNIRAILWLEVVNSRHVLEFLVFMFDQSLPSGNPGTTIINVLYNLLVFRICWVMIFGVSHMSAFRDMVVLIVFGDDNIWSAHSSIRDKFNGISVKDAMLRIGLTYTSADKKEMTAEFSSILEVEFLKRGFRFDKSLNRWVSTLRLSVILEMVLWTKNKYDSVKITIDNVDTALMELSLHGKEVFDKYAPKLTNALFDAHDVYPKNTSFHSNFMKACSHDAWF